MRRSTKACAAGSVPARRSPHVGPPTLAPPNVVPPGAAYAVVVAVARPAPAFVQVSRPLGPTRGAGSTRTEVLYERA
jgi:hypothetical protein